MFGALNDLLAAQKILLAIPTAVRHISYMRKKTKAAPLPSITEAEWTVMRVIWERGTATANDVVEALEGAMHWKPKTIHTLLRRLADKGALDYEKSGREFVFRPLVTERDCQLAESRSFLDRVFGGGVAPMVAAFVEQEKLTAEEIVELKRILKKGVRQ
jgi:BlaI family transcriptional regulator, penicillinase repressor